MGFGGNKAPVNVEAKRIDELNARPLPEPEQIEKEAQETVQPEQDTDKKTVSRKALKRPVVQTLTV